MAVIQRAKSLVFVKHQLVEDLQAQYLNELNPRILWEEFKLQFDHLRLIFFLEARYDCLNLRLHDHTLVAAYNSALFCIVSQLALCGEPVDDKEQI